ncbi:MAG: aminotransferase class IV [Akkermansiaceae bacterium]
MNDVPMVWINGKLIPAGEVRVSPFDLGLTVGFGVFETMVAYDGKPFLFELHYHRMRVSANELGGSIRVPEIELLQSAVTQVLQANDLASVRSRLRISISGGSNDLAGSGTQQSGNVIVTAVALAEPAVSAKLTRVPYSIDEMSVLSGIKCASYAANVMAYRNAVAQGADEAVIFNKEGNLCEGAMSNIFLVRDGTVYTPSLSNGCLAGVTRSVVIQLCEELQIPLFEYDLSEIDLLTADEIFLTSSTREVQLAVMLGESVKDHPITSKLALTYRAFVNNSTQ